MKKRNNEEKELYMLFNKAASLADEKIGEEMRNGKEHTFSSEHEEKAKELFARERQRGKLRKILLMSKRAACIAVVSLAILTLAVGHVGAWRLKFLNFVFDSEQPNMDIVFGDRGVSYSDDDFVINYLPVGFRIKDKISTDKSRSLVFKLNDDYIRIIKIKDDSLNIENKADNIESVEINGNLGIFVAEKSFNMIIWEKDDSVIEIDSTYSKEEMIRIAENITY